MGEILRKRLLQSRFESPSQEAFLNLMVASAHLRERAQRLFETQTITPAQYNVLRILRGAHPEGFPRCEVARRMIERAPDLTRMIDRLERLGLVERGRSDQDRRRSVARITRKGLEQIEHMKPVLDALHRRLSERLSRAEAAQLSRLCEKLYGQS